MPFPNGRSRLFKVWEDLSLGWEVVEGALGKPMGEEWARQVYYKARFRIFRDDGGFNVWDGESPHPVFMGIDEVSDQKIYAFLLGELLRLNEGGGPFWAVIVEEF
ncbi:hypothetical protein A2716_01785 [candidate division WWE3 bacterium RIFCSPHIGHO2_01_FULL_40_23]|uniref:Uncharacterized protein n=1 Tax=candidate division WWE3 bacterium RIFCSPLOWO2_01_FULL_41_18 TaxID=1802625 RepID=A0A1F4VEN0_UNCKA|nr:MAG: hypothetical protein A2716_01785 [candidate division WWE3 bacterium RIFCSPHIGHO2_01_FULL_40_23]OGC55722.1 MAG: hypothetical protein A3A78_01635 [candidate division WWE3 bacterium RIFCSPLOWO2_01_FULL_41_18]